MSSSLRHVTAIILDGQALADKVKKRVHEEIAELDIVPGLGTILVGNDPASESYVGAKIRDCEEIGRAHVRTPVTRGSRMPSSA